MEPWIQEQAMTRSVRPAPLDGRASYQTWTGVFNGQYRTLRHPAALFPERYAPNSGLRPWHCPVVGCGESHQFFVELAGHFTYAHLGVTLCDNRNGTFTILVDEEQADPRGYAYVAAQRAILAGPRASFPFAAPAWTPDGTVTPEPEHADDNQGNGVAAADDEAWRDSGISMGSSSDEDSSGEEGGGEEDEGSDEDEDDDDDTVVGGDSDNNNDSDDDFPEETVVIPNALAVDVQTPGDGGSSPMDGDHMDVDGNHALVDQAAISPIAFPILQLRPLQPGRELPDPTPLQLEIWPYITSWTLYPLPLPSPSSPAHRTLLALLRFPRIRFLPVSWQERLRARTPSLGTLTAVALYLGGRADFGSPCQSHCGQYGALVERLYAFQREEGAGQWKLEKKFAFPRCVKVPEALERDPEVEEVLGGRPCCNHFFRELRGTWETSEPFPPRPSGGLESAWNEPMW